MAYTDTDTASNYLGELFLVGANKTPFLNLMGGLNGARSKTTRSLIFPMAQPWSIESPSIPTLTEDNIVTAATASTTVTRGQDLNTCQYFKEDVIVSYPKIAQYGALTGLAALGNQPVTDEMAFQKMTKLKKLANDYELSALTGTYAAAANSSTNPQMGGIITACATNTESAGSVDVTKAVVDALMQEMAGNGALFENMYMFLNAWNKGVITDLYGYQPEDRNVGGINIQRILTDFCELQVMYAPNMPTSTILVADMNYVYPVFLPYRGQTLFYEDLAKTAAAERGQFIMFAGVDYGPEEYHGTITSTSIS